MNISKCFLASVSLALSLPASANLYFSEYVEGSSLNKALEIYNAGAAPVDLSTYQVQIYFNGSASPGSAIGLAGTLDPGAVFVLAHGSADPAILAVANQVSSSVLFNGNDAIVLFDGPVVVDSIGQSGFDPGVEWGTGDVSTLDNTLRRKTSVTAGDTDPTDVFDPALEWDGFAGNSFADLGTYDAGDPPVLARIHEIQGSGASSPLAGQQVVVEAIVVGDFQHSGAADNGDLSGFFIQEEDADADADGNTSEGLFVFDGSGVVDVALGDLVRVTGMVSEFNGSTEITAFGGVEILASNQPLPAVTPLSLPVASLDDFEPFEGMYVQFPQSLVISEYFNFDRFNEIVLAVPLSDEDRQIVGTAVEMPGSAAYEARRDLNLRSRITLDDGRRNQNLDPAIHPNGMVFDLGNRFRGGDLVQGATGVLDYAFGIYRLQPTAGANYVPANPRPELPPYIDAGITVASFNVVNYFNSLDMGTPVCGPLADLDCRGADDAEEFTRQRDKIIAALAAIDADIVGLVEIENNAGAAVDDLIAGLNSVVGAGAYDKIDTGTIGDDAIKVAFIYKPASVAPSGDFAILDGSVDARFLDRNRPSLAQTFVSLANSGRFTVAVNHFKSRGSSCDDIGDPDIGDGQGNCNLTRVAAAAALVDWLAADPTASGDADFLIVGDLNAYDKEDPIAGILAAGYTDLLLRDGGELAYSYLFDGELGYLDHALANASLEPQAVAAAAWHINADEPDILDYDTSFKQPAQDALYEANPFRSSDHDPVIVGLDLLASIDDILAYVEQAANDGTLEGTGPSPAAERRLEQFLERLRAAGLGDSSSPPPQACALLGVAESLSDGEPMPMDMVQGEAADTLSAIIGDYLERYCR